MLPNKPYVFRSFYQWIVDSECTPFMVVDTTVDYVDVPEEYIDNNQIVLNLSPIAVLDLVQDNRFVSFSAQFSGVDRHIYVPIAAISAIYAKENGRGMMFEGIDEDADHPMMQPVPPKDGGDDSSGGGASHLKVIK